MQVLVDQAHLETTLRGLLLDAVMASANGPSDLPRIMSADLSLAPNGDAVLSIADNGCGLGPSGDRLPPRNASPDEEPWEGTSLGSVRRLLASWDGSVSLSPRPGRGALLTLTLPRARD